MPPQASVEQEIYVDIPIVANTSDEARAEAEKSIGVLFDFPEFSAAYIKALIESADAPKTNSLYSLILILNVEHITPELLAVLQKVGDVQHYDTLVPAEEAEELRIVEQIREAIKNHRDQTLLSLFEGACQTALPEKLSIIFYQLKRADITDSSTILLDKRVGSPMSRAFFYKFKENQPGQAILARHVLSEITVDDFMTARSLGEKSLISLITTLYEASKTNNPAN